MGVDLGDLAVKNTISLENLSGKIVAIDAYNILYQFLASIRQEDGTSLMDSKGRVTAHLAGLFYRNSKLLENGIKPVYIFDGKQNKLKARTQGERAQAKEKALEKWKVAMEEERVADARKYAQATTKLTKEIIEESIAFLSALGIPSMRAPSDAEAQAAMMCQQGIVYATGSQDYDALLFGSPILVRNLSITGRRKVPRQDKYVIVEPEQIRLQETLDSLGLTREQLIFLGMLIGTDFNEGVKGIGPKKALKIVKEVKTLSELVASVRESHKYEFEVEPQEVFDIFVDPAYTEPPELEWIAADKDRIKKILVEEHEFSEERVDRTLLQLIKESKEKGAQKKLEQWF